MKHLTTAEYKAIKDAIAAGLSRKQIISLSGRSYFTVGMIEASDSLEAMRESNRQRVAKSKQPKEEPADVPEEEPDVLQNINDSLVDINNCLKWLVENTPVPNSKKWWTK